MMDVRIGIATKTDIPALNVLVNSAYRGDSSRQGWTTEADFLDGIRTSEEALGELLNDTSNTVLLAFDDANNLLGCVHLQNKGAAMYLGMLTVQPALQAKGIGRQLMAAAENFAKQQGCTTIEMTVISIRDTLIAWYNKHGYEATGEKKPFPDDIKFGIKKRPLEFMVMRKKLQDIV